MKGERMMIEICKHGAPVQLCVKCTFHAIYAEHYISAKKKIKTMHELTVNKLIGQGGFNDWEVK